MAERSSLNQVVQIGVETTPGTGVAADKRLQSISIEPSPSVEMDTFRPTGQKFNALSTLSKEWTEASVSGRATYSEIIYLLSSVLNTGVITSPDATLAPTARKWVFAPSSTADDVPKTFTIEHGSSVRASKFTYALMTEMGMAFSRDTVEVTGSLMGRSITDNITMTAAPTSLPLIPVLPTQVSVYLDNTAAALGTTKLTRALTAEWSIGSRFGPLWVLDAANPSYVTHIETVPDLSAGLMLEADAQGMGLLSTLRAGDTKFLRIEALGSTIGGAVRYLLTVDLAVKVSDMGGFSDADGVYAAEFSFTGVHDATWGKSMEVSVVNTQAAL